MISELALANLDVIEFECPRCLHLNRVASEKSGQRIDCSSCQGSLLVPSKTTGQDLFEDIFDSQSSDPGSTHQIDQIISGLNSADSSQEHDFPADDSDSGQLAGANDDPLSEISIQKFESPLDDINPLQGEDPFQVDPDAPLKIDGMGDIFDHADVYGIKCDICDTRIHVRPDQANTYVECPECFSKVLVRPPEEKPPAPQRWVKEGRDKSSKKEEVDDELKLSAPVIRPKIDFDESFGLESPAEDLLAPKPKPTPDRREDYNQEFIDDPERKPATTTTGQSKDARTPPARPGSDLSSSPSSRSPGSGRGKSRRELYEEAQRRQQAAETGNVYHPVEPSTGTTSTDFPDVEFGSLLGAAYEMLKSRGLFWRISIAITLMCFGTIAMEWYRRSSLAVVSHGNGSTVIESLTQGAAWLIVGVLPYLLGLATLWFASAYVYRDAALGQRQVKSWKNAGRSEVSATFLIFSFGYFVGGLFVPPVGIFQYLILPLRMFIAPLFLLSSWYGRSPFLIVSIDAFQQFQKQKGLWIEFYKFMTVLACVSLIAGLFFWIRGMLPGSAFGLIAMVSVIGVMMITGITLLFAAVCGWHCGRVVQGLQESD